jgi:hypothetical protein
MFSTFLPHLFGSYKFNVAGFRPVLEFEHDQSWAKKRLPSLQFATALQSATAFQFAPTSRRSLFRHSKELWGYIYKITGRTFARRRNPPFLERPESCFEQWAANWMKMHPHSVRAGVSGFRAAKLNEAVKRAIYNSGMGLPDRTTPRWPSENGGCAWGASLSYNFYNWMIFHWLRILISSKLSCYPER